MFRVNSHEEKENASWPVRWAERWPVAVALVFACAAGGWLVWRHWMKQPWPDRAAMLGGPGQFQPLPPPIPMTRELSALAADQWLPPLGFLLLAAGALLGRTVAAGPDPPHFSSGGMDTGFPDRCFLGPEPSPSGHHPSCSIQRCAF